MAKHKKLIEELLRAERPVGEILEKLQRHGWDCDDALAVLTREHIVSVIKRYLTGEFTATAVEEWSNAIECREDVEFEKSHEEEIKNIIFEMANPDITEKLTRQKAQEWISTLCRDQQW